MRLIELPGHVRVDADARHVHEETAAQLADIHRGRRGLDRLGDRQFRTAIDAQLGRQPVTRSGRDDAERHVAERQRRGDLIDRAVAAPRHHEARALPDRNQRELARMTGALGDEHVGALAVPFDDGRGQARAPGSGVRAGTS